MRVIIHFGRAADGREGDACLLEIANQVGKGVGGYRFGDSWNGPVASFNLIHPFLQTRICLEISQPQNIAQGLPLAFRDSPDENLSIIGGVEDVIDRPGKFTLGHWRCFASFDVELHHMLRHKKKAVFEQSGPHRPSLVIRHSLQQRTQNGKGAEEACHYIIGR